MADLNGCEIRESGTTGHEILVDGVVVAWTVNQRHALLIASLLNLAIAGGLWLKDGQAHPSA